MLHTDEILSTIEMLHAEHLDVATAVRTLAPASDARAAADVRQHADRRADLEFVDTLTQLRTTARADGDVDLEYQCWLALCAFEGWRVMKLTDPALSTARFAAAYEVLIRLVVQGSTLPDR